MKHLKPTLLLLLITFAGVQVFAQATVTSTIIDKENRHAVMIVIDQPLDVTEAALEQRLKRSGLSGKTNNGITIYKAVTLSELSTAKVDIYTRVEKNKDKDKNSSIVYIAVSTGYNNFISETSDPVLNQNIKNFLNSFVKDVSAYSLDLQISTQADIVKNNEKQYERLQNDRKDLERDKAGIESSIVNKDRESAEKKTELERQKEELEKLKGRRSQLN
jgi:hypothetical protein